MTGRERLKKAFILTVPVMTGYLFLGIGFGVMLEAEGYSILWATIMSILMYAGSMQYVAVGLLAESATLLTAALTTLMVNARHLFYGISLIDKYKGAGIRKPYMIFALTDETYSLVCSDDSNDKKLYFLISVFDHCYWITGCTLGAVIGKLIPFSTEGIEFTLTALFVTIFVEQWISSKEHISALIGVAATVLCLVVFGKDLFLIASMKQIKVMII